MSIKPVLGTMTFGPQVDQACATQMVRRFLEQGHQELDTAYVYNNGDSENFLGVACQPEELPKPHIATKVNPRVTGKLDAQSIKGQLATSLQRLQVSSVDTLYLHFPDPATPMEETLSACAELHQLGWFKALGLSNYPAWQVVHIWHLCKKNGWPEPEVYQGLYNALSRSVEEELIPALRALGMRFYAYNPLAGGILAGKYSGYDDSPAPGRFTHRPNYKQRYWKKEFFEALYGLRQSCEEEGVTMLEAAFRWLSEHSALDSNFNDGILIGASSLSQLEQNLNLVGRGPLPPRIVEAFEAAWVQAASEAPPYFRTTN